MIKAELIDVIASGVDGLTRAKAEQVLNATLQAIMESVGKGDAVNLIGFGVFGQGEHVERMTRDPRTGKEVKVEAAKTVRLKAGQKLKDTVNA